jgi:hypothetical protein
MKKLILLSILTVIAVHCSAPEPTFANDSEKIVINDMDCWNSYLGELYIRSYAFASDEKKKDKLMDKFLEDEKEATEWGRKSLLNDTIFITCIRSDTTYNALLKQREILAKSLNVYVYNTPSLREFLNKTISGVIEYNYNYNRSLFGIYEKSYEEDNFLIAKKYYSSYNELLRTAYIKNILEITDDNLSAIMKTLSEIENIDRHIWCVPHYKKSEEACKEKQAQKELRKDRERKFKELTN